MTPNRVDTAPRYCRLHGARHTCRYTVAVVQRITGGPSRTAKPHYALHDEPGE